MVEQHDDVTDEAIVARLLAAPTDGWARLWKAVDEMAEEAEHATWAGGQQVGTTIVDGVEKPVTQMPYPVYSEPVNRIVAHLYGQGVIVPFDWGHWDGPSRYQGGAGLNSAPVAESVRMLTAYVRAERFGDGNIAAGIENGTLPTALSRLRKWYDEERPAANPQARPAGAPAGTRPAVTTLDAVQLDRATGALLGLAVGDALGAAYEFQPDPPAHAEMIGGGPFGFAPGEWTDDTQMAVCVAEVAATGHLDPAAVGDRFLAWFREGQKDVGNQTRSVLGRATDGADLARVAAEHFARNPGGSAGNGSLMRTAPVALAHLGDDDSIAEPAQAISALTHADPRAEEACVLWCIAIDRAIREARLDGIRDGLDLLTGAARGRWSSLLDDAEREPTRRFRPNGFVVTALQAAHAAVHQTPVPKDEPCAHLQHALRAAVHIGDDTDTVAAIAGSLLGARWGASAVPLAWRGLVHGWPGYRAADLTRLAALTARRGHVDSAGWPTARRLGRPYYQAAFPAPPIDVELIEDPGVRIGNVAGLGQPRTGAAPDVVVSLCRVGPDDSPAGSETHQLFLVDSAANGANPNLDFVLRDTAAAMVRWREAGRTVFVHCVAGESRTPTVAAAYLAERFGLTGREALDRVREALPIVRPNPAFMAALDRLWPAAPP